MVLKVKYCTVPCTVFNFLCNDPLTEMTRVVTKYFQVLAHSFVHLLSLLLLVCTCICSKYYILI